VDITAGDNCPGLRNKKKVDTNMGPILNGHGFMGVL
jgi:hypothetical protein